MQRHRFAGAMAGLAGVCLLGVGAAVLVVAPGRWPARPPAVPTSAAGDPEGQPVVPSPSAPTVASIGSAPPARLSIPALGVEAQVEPVGTDAQGRMEVPSRPDRVSWYRLGTSPGQSGNAVLAGHYDWTNGPAVFWKLKHLKVGDEIAVIRTNGERVGFIVRASEVVTFDARPSGMFTTSGPPSLSLVTCTGAWDRQRGTYLERLVVHASLAVQAPAEKPGDEAG